MCDPCRHGDRIVVGTIAGVLAADVWLLRRGHRPVSDTVGRAIAAHPVLTLGAMGYVLAHWAAVLLPADARKRFSRIDLLHMAGERLVG